MNNDVKAFEILKQLYQQKRRELWALTRALVELQDVLRERYDYAHSFNYDDGEDEASFHT